MTNNTVKKIINAELEKNNVILNKMTISGVTKTEEGCSINKIILSLSSPQDNDIAKILRCRQNLDEQNIILNTVLIEL